MGFTWRIYSSQKQTLYGFNTNRNRFLKKKIVPKVPGKLLDEVSIFY